MDIVLMLRDPYTKSGEPVYMKLRGQAADEIESLRQQLAEAQGKATKYEQWFHDNATMLCTHQIGGCCFGETIALDTEQKR